MGVRSGGGFSGGHGGFSGGHGGGFSGGHGGFSGGHSFSSGRSNGFSGNRGGFRPSGGGFSGGPRPGGMGGGPRPGGMGGPGFGGPRPRPVTPPPMYHPHHIRHGWLYRPYIIPPYFLYGPGRTVVNNNYYGNNGSAGRDYGSYANSQDAEKYRNYTFTEEDKINAYNQMISSCNEGIQKGLKHIIIGIFCLLIALMLFIKGIAVGVSAANINVIPIHSVYAASSYTGTVKAYDGFFDSDAIKDIEAALTSYGEVKKTSYYLYVPESSKASNSAVEKYIGSISPDNDNTIYIVYNDKTDYWSWYIGDAVKYSDSAVEKQIKTISERIYEAYDAGYSVGDAFARGINNAAQGISPDKQSGNTGNNSGYSDDYSGNTNYSGNQSDGSGFRGFLIFVLVIVGGGFLISGIPTYTMNKKEKERFEAEKLSAQNDEILSKGFQTYKDQEFEDLKKKYE